MDVPGTALPVNEDVLPDIPGWEIVRLGDLAEIQSGGTPSRGSPEFYGGAVSWVKTLDLNEREVATTEECITKPGFESIRGKVRPPGTVMVAMYGGAGTVGKSGILSISAATNQAVCCIEPNPKKFDSLFLLFFMIRYRAEWMKYAIGTRKDPNISKGIIVGLRLALPPLAEQRAIAHVLRAVQRAKESAEAVVASARQLKRSLLRHLFTYGPVPVAEADRVPLKETEIGPIPEHWQIKRLGDIAKIGNGSTPSRSTPRFWDGGSIPWLTSGKIHERIIRHADEFVTPTAQAECHLPTVKKGSVLVAITGQGKTLGNAALLDIDTCISQHLAYIQPHTTNVRSDYLLEYLGTRYEHFRQAANAGGSTKGALTCGYLKTYPLPLPPPAEQQIIGSMADAADRRIQTEQARVSALGELFRSLLRDLMTGRVRVHELGLVPAIESGA